MILLAYDIFKCGHLPKEILLEEFPHKHYFSKSISYPGLVNIDGNNYVIISKKKCDNDDGYLYTIAHTKINRNWLIFSDKSTKKFSKILSRGVFNSNSDNNDGEYFTENIFEQMSMLFDNDLV